MKKCSVIFVLFVLSFGFVVVNCNLTLNGTKCGQKICNRGEYCSSYHTICEPCSKICDNKGHNYDESDCVKKCQDYIHDSLYLSKDDAGSGDENLRATVQRLSRMVTVTLTLVCFMLAALAVVLCLQIIRWKKKKNITLASIKSKFFSKKSDSNSNKTATQNQTNNEKPDLRLEMPTESTHSGNSPVTVTTAISRRPAEDSTLDYAYDNPAMATSPTTNKSNPNSY